MKIDIFNTSNKYNVIYADPPREYKRKGTSGKHTGMASQNYPTMTTADISKIPVNNISADECICFMWATFPNIAEALEVMTKWGFIYKTAAFVWVKKNKKSNTNFMGMGAYTRANSEVCLLGVKKNTKAGNIIKSHAVNQIIEAPVEYHSKKPDIVRSRIMELTGDLPKIELFARQQTEGFDCWGNEV